MSEDVPPERQELESQLMSIMDVLVRAAVTEISQLLSESSASLRLQLSQSLKDNEALRSRMKTMRSELFSLRLQTRTSRPASRFSPIRGHVQKARVKTQAGGECFYFEKTLTGCQLRWGEQSSSLLGFVPSFRKLQRQLTSTHASSSHSGIGKQIRELWDSKFGRGYLPWLLQIRKEEDGHMKTILIPIERDAFTMS